MSRLWRLLAWFALVDLLITIFGVMTAPLLIALAADAAVVALLIRSLAESRTRPAALAE